MTRWYKEKKREHFYKQAKRVGYRARSAYKLKQIQKKFKILEQGNIVVDLGAAPGGWSQVVKEIIGEKGIVVGIDLLPIRPIKGISFLKGDINDENSIGNLMNFLNGKKADVVISDMSPDISGNYSIDHARSIYLCHQALKTAERLLKLDGNFLCKVFSGNELQDFIERLKEKFSSVYIYSPPASRKSSSEVYVISKSFRNR